MAIAQMNWGRMRYALTDERMAEFADALGHVYLQAERHHGFIWRISDDDAFQQLTALGHDPLLSATVSVWKDVASLRDYTFTAMHGDFLGRSKEWFETISGPQLVIWNVANSARPTFADAFARLDMLARNGPTSMAYGWEQSQ